MSPSLWARRGIARRMMAAVEADIVAAGYDTAALTATLTGIPFYRQLGGYHGQEPAIIRLPGRRYCRTLHGEAPCDARRGPATCGMIPVHELRSTAVTNRGRHSSSQQPVQYPAAFLAWIDMRQVGNLAIGDVRAGRGQRLRAPCAPSTPETSSPTRRAPDRSAAR